MEGVSLKLKEAIEDIKDILKKHDVMGNVFLADGEGHGEFILGLDLPTWSKIRFLTKKDGSAALHLKAHMKSDKENSNKTINAFCNITEIQATTYLMLDQIGKEFNKRLDIEEDKGKIISHQEFLKHQKNIQGNNK